MEPAIRKFVPPASRGGRIAGIGFYCQACGYDRRGSPVDGPCAECGFVGAGGYRKAGVIRRAITRLLATPSVLHVRRVARRLGRRVAWWFTHSVCDPLLRLTRAALPVVAAACISFGAGLGIGAVLFPDRPAGVASAANRPATQPATPSPALKPTTAPSSTAATSTPLVRTIVTVQWREIGKVPQQATQFELPDPQPDNARQAQDRDLKRAAER